MPRARLLLILLLLALGLPLSSINAQHVHTRPASTAEEGKAMLPSRINCPDLLDFERLPLTPAGNIKADEINFSDLELVFDYYQVAGWLKGYLFARSTTTPKPGEGKSDRNVQDWMLAIFYLCRTDPTNNLLIIADALAMDRQ